MDKKLTWQKPMICLLLNIGLVYLFFWLADKFDMTIWYQAATMALIIGVFILSSLFLFLFAFSDLTGFPEDLNEDLKNESNR